MEMDSLEKAYGDGHNAYHDGKSLKDNPYKRFSSEWDSWKTGWNDEKKDDPYWERVKQIRRLNLIKLKNNKP